MNEETNTNKPHWARRIDEYSKHRWHKEKPYPSKRAEYIWNIIWNLVFLFIVNKVPDWHLKFINEHYGVVLWILNINIIIQIAGNLIMAIFNIRFLRYIITILTDIASFLTLMVFYYVYPFDFSAIHGWSWLDIVITIGLIIGMVVTALKVLGTIWKLIFWR